MTEINVNTSKSNSKRLNICENCNEEFKARMDKEGRVSIFCPPCVQAKKMEEELR